MDKNIYIEKFNLLLNATPEVIPLPALEIIWDSFIHEFRYYLKNKYTDIRLNISNEVPTDKLDMETASLHISDSSSEEDDTDPNSYKKGSIMIYESDLSLVHPEHVDNHSPDESPPAIKKRANSGN